jgi:tetratricopeptide (TPR) repeat protein
VLVPAIRVPRSSAWGRVVGGRILSPARMIRDLLNRVVDAVRGGGSEGALSVAELASLEKEAAAAPPQRRAQLFNRLGDAYVRAGDRGAAVRSYGRGIDGYLEFGFYDAAAALCRKLIDYDPTVIRARCTLAFLSLGKEMFDDAHREIREYVEASRVAGLEELAVKRLHFMVEATDSIETRTLIGEILLELGDAEGADRVLGAVHAERNDLIGPPLEEQRERWARLLRVAITDIPPDTSAAPRRPKGI